MARMTDTRELVNLCWLEIFAKTGKAPNDAQVKEWLLARVGSARNGNTISQELQAIRARAERALFESISMPGLPPSIPDELRAGVSGLFAQMVQSCRDFAAGEFTAERERIQSQAAADVQAAEAIAAQARSEVSALSEKVQQQESEIAALTSADMHKGEQIAVLQEQSKGLTARLATETARADRAVEMREHELAQHRAEIAKSDERYKGFEAVMTQRVIEEQNKVAHLRADLDALRGSNTVLAEERVSALRRCSELQGQLSEISAVLDKTRQQLDGKIALIARTGAAPAVKKKRPLRKKAVAVPPSGKKKSRKQAAAR